MHMINRHPLSIEWIIQLTGIPHLPSRVLFVEHPLLCMQDEGKS